MLRFNDETKQVEVVKTIKLSSKERAKRRSKRKAQKKARRRNR